MLDTEELTARFYQIKEQRDLLLTACKAIASIKPVDGKASKNRGAMLQMQAIASASIEKANGVTVMVSADGPLDEPALADVVEAAKRHMQKQAHPELLITISSARECVTRAKDKIMDRHQMNAAEGKTHPMNEWHHGGALSGCDDVLFQLNELAKQLEGA